MDSSGVAIGIYAASGFIAAISQLILKFVAVKTNGKTGLMQYIDLRIVAAYTMLLSTVFLNMIAMRYIPYKFVPVLSSLSYVFVLILGKIVLHEEVSKKRMMGILLIFAGIFVFYAG